MSLFEETVAKIKPPDNRQLSEMTENLAGCRWGRLGEMLLKYAGIFPDKEFAIPKPLVVIAAADHGVAKHKTSAYAQNTTYAMTANYLISGGAAANAFANFIGADLLTVDVGIAADTSDLPGLRNEKIAYGTKDMTEGAAMTLEEAVRAVETGIKIADEAHGKGYACFLPGEMGIANTAVSAAICACICDLPPDKVTGLGTNISEARYQKKIEIVRRALEINRPDPADGLDVLAKVGGFEFGCIAGIILGAAKNRDPVILDGFNSGAAALIACSIAPEADNYLLASHLSAEKGHVAALKHLGLTPIMDLDLRLGEACGSSIALSFLNALIFAYRAKFNPTKKKKLNSSALKRMSKKHSPVTDRTFDFYLATMPRIDRASMALCQTRLDHLTKPVHSLGCLEKIFARLAGITADERPEIETGFGLVCLTKGRTSKLSTAQDALTYYANADVARLQLVDGLPLTAYFDFARIAAEELSFKYSVVGVAILPSDTEEYEQAKREFKSALVDGKGDLLLPPEEFLAAVPPKLQPEAAAIVGAIIAAAHNRSLILLDDEITEIIARYTLELCPEAEPYVYPFPGKVFAFGSAAPLLNVCYGKKLVDAAVRVLDSMKTFEETSVPPADDGPGRLRQGFD